MIGALLLVLGVFACGVPDPPAPPASVAEASLQLVSDDPEERRLAVEMLARLPDSECADLPDEALFGLVLRVRESVLDREAVRLLALNEWEIQALDALDVSAGVVSASSVPDRQRRQIEVSQMADRELLCRSLRDRGPLEPDIWERCCDNEIYLERARVDPEAGGSPDGTRVWERPDSFCTGRDLTSPGEPESPLPFVPKGP